MDVTDLTRVKALHLPRIGQLGFVVRRIDDSLPYYASFYNIHTWYEPRYDEKHYWAGTERVDLQQRLLMGFSGRLQIELIEAGGTGHLYADYIAQHGEGLQHLGFYVSDLDRRQKMAQDLGIPIVFSGRFKTTGGGTAKFAYLDTCAKCGTVLELIEIRLYGLSLPQTQFFYNIGSLTGDTVKVKAWASTT
jgi:methylmalonyl-CoA/ethylmalonyl-CoA epimerase